MKNFKNLKVWQRGIELVVDVYKKTNNFPNEELYGLTSQIKRSAISIPSNIAEGSGRGSKKDFNRFLDISLGSSFELETQLIIAKRLDFINDDFNFKFDHSLIKVSDDFAVSDLNYFNNVIVNKDPNFKNSFDRDFELDTLSVVKDKGKTEYGNLFPLDINMQNRNADTAPDMGAYERIETP